MTRATSATTAFRGLARQARRMPVERSLFATTALAASPGPGGRHRLGSSDVFAEATDDAAPEDEELLGSGDKPAREPRLEYLRALQSDGGDAADVAGADEFHEFPPRG